MIENSLGPFPLQIQQVYFIRIVILWHKLVLHVTFIIKEEQKWVLWYYWCHSCCYSSVLFCPVHCVSCDLVAGITCDHSCWGELEMCKSCKKEGGMLSEESYLAWKSVKCVIIKKKTTTLPPPPTLPRKRFCRHRVGEVLPACLHPFWNSRCIPVALKTEYGLYY